MQSLILTEESNLLKGLHSAAGNKVSAIFTHTPIDVGADPAWPFDLELMKLAVKSVKKEVQASCDVPLTLHK